MEERKRRGQPGGSGPLRPGEQHLVHAERCQRGHSATEEGPDRPRERKQQQEKRDENAGRKHVLRDAVGREALRIEGGPHLLGVHSIAIDSKGNLYTTETWEGKRLQRFVYKGMAPVTKMDQGTVWPSTR